MTSHSLNDLHPSSASLCGILVFVPTVGSMASRTSKSSPVSKRHLEFYPRSHHSVWERILRFPCFGGEESLRSCIVQQWW